MTYVWQNSQSCIWEHVPPPKIQMHHDASLLLIVLVLVLVLVSLHLREVTLRRPVSKQWWIGICSCLRQLRCTKEMYIRIHFAAQLGKFHHWGAHRILASFCAILVHLNQPDKKPKQWQDKLSLCMSYQSLWGMRFHPGTQRWRLSWSAQPPLTTLAYQGNL